MLYVPANRPPFDVLPEENTGSGHDLEPKGEPFEFLASRRRQKPLLLENYLGPFRVALIGQCHDLHAVLVENIPTVLHSSLRAGSRVRRRILALDRKAIR
jgi:hypothetical protein